MLTCDLEWSRATMRIRAQLVVPAQTVMCVFGPSGAGKSSVLSAIAGFAPDAHGNTQLCGSTLQDDSLDPPRFVPPWRREIAYVMQDPVLFGHLSVAQNIGYGRSARRGSAKEAAQASLGGQIESLVSALELTELIGKRPQVLSGGERRRVAIAAALARDCPACLLDEPFTGQDAPRRSRLQAAVKDLLSTTAASAVIVTHDLHEAQAVADHLALMIEGRIVQQGPIADVLDKPNSLTAAVALGWMPPVPGACAVNRRPGLVCGHPDRIVLGRFDEHGIVYAGIVARVSARGGRLVVLVQLRGCDAAVDVALDPLAALAQPTPEPGTEVAVTLLSPLVFAESVR
jgi:ABC-type sulfate/molybdate transport systems ATPase subunit